MVMLMVMMVMRMMMMMMKNMLMMSNCDGDDYTISDCLIQDSSDAGQ
jgi:hypothetical protein